jgi:hypothetical protein
MRIALLLLTVLLASVGSAQTVPKGTPIKLMFLKEISSSGSYPGDVVPLVVTGDVVVRGDVLIPEGTMAFAKVTQSRREGALSAPLFDKPARLAIKFEHLRDVHGNVVRLCPKPQKEGELSITREMTVTPTSAESKELEMLWESPTARPVMEKVRRLFVDSATHLTQKEALILVEHNAPIPAVGEAIRSGLFGDVVSFIDDLKRGRTVEALLKLNPVTRPAYLAVRAVRQLGRLSGGVGNYVEGRFKGRNIRCSAGVEITVYAGLQPG